MPNFFDRWPLTSQRGNLSGRPSIHARSKYEIESADFNPTTGKVNGWVETSALANWTDRNHGYVDSPLPEFERSETLFTSLDKNQSLGSYKPKSPERRVINRVPDDWFLIHIWQEFVTLVFGQIWSNQPTFY